MGLVTRKPCLVRLNPGLLCYQYCSSNIEILHGANLYIILSDKQITKVLIRLHRCADWSVPLLLAFNKIRFFLQRGPLCYSTWALTRENLSSGVCEQQRRKSACTSAQSDQHFCNSLIGKYQIKTCYKRNFTILATL